MTSTRPRRSRRGPGLWVAVAATAAILAGFVVGCSSDDDASSDAALDQVAPTKADVAHDAGISFPASTSDFRLVRISADQVDVTFTVDAADVDAFATGSKLTLVPDQRVITHASPLWELTVEGAELRGATSASNGLTRDIEVIANGATADVRLSIRRG